MPPPHADAPRRGSTYVQCASHRVRFMARDNKITRVRPSSSFLPSCALASPLGRTFISLLPAEQTVSADEHQ